MSIKAERCLCYAQNDVDRKRSSDDASYGHKHKQKKTCRSKSFFVWWREMDSNHRSRRRQIYSLLPLATRESLRIKYGAGDGTRTRNLLITNQLLCQLSYTSFFGASGRNRTTDTGIFSPLLYRLSYRGDLLGCLHWWAFRDSNPGPIGYEPTALTS